MILLIQPRANKYDALTIRVPNGLLSIAAPLVREKYDVAIIDQKIHPDWRERIDHYLKMGVSCVGVTCSTGNMIYHALKVSNYVKEKSPDTPVVWGGPHPSLLPEQTLAASKCIDIVVVNEGDVTFFELVQAIEGKSTLRDVNGIYYKEGEYSHVCSTPPRALIKNLDELDSLPYHLLEMEKYSSIQTTNKKTKSIDIMSSRGCPFNCGFCSIPVMPGRHWRAKSVERIMEEIVFLKNRYSIEEFYFIDDNFMVDLKRVEEFVDALLSEDVNIMWGLQGVRVESIMKANVSLLDKLEKAGLTELSIGVESGNPRILDIIDKRIKPEDVLMMNRKLHGRSFQIKYNFIIGFPTETKEEVEKSVNLALLLAKENNRVWFPFNIFSPFPGTKIFDMTVQNGFKPPTTLEGWIEIESSGRKSRFRNYIDKDLYKFMCNINAVSYIAFPIAKTKITNKLYRFLFSLYSPIAYYRFSRHFYFFFIEKYIMKFILK